MIQSPVIRRILWAVAILGTANFLVFVLIAFLIGGDAFNGKAAGDHFFVADHGKLTEVSAATFKYSLWHVWSIFITSPLMILAYLLLNRHRGRKSGR